MDKHVVRPRPHGDSYGAYRFDLRRLHCTRSDSDPVCQLLWRLEACNQLISHIGFQLREEEEDDIGELRLVLTPLRVIPHSWTAPTRIAARIRAAMDLFQRLCQEHRCVTLIELDYDVARYEVLLAAIRESVGVKRLRICDFHNLPRDNPGLFHVILGLITSMEHVDELVFRKRQHHSIDSVPLPSFSISRLGGTTLRKLNVADLNLKDSEVSKLITLLMGNDTVTELAVGTSVCMFAGMETSLGFADYLAKAKDTLRSLTLRSLGFCSTPHMTRLANTVAAMTALEELVVDMVPCGSEGTNIFAEVLEWSTTLRHFSVVLPPWWDRSITYGVFNEPDTGFRSIRRWLTGLAKTTVLETLTLDLLGFHLDDCLMLFLALAENESIRQMTVHRLIEWGCVESTCHVIREYDLTERVLIKDHNMNPHTMSKLPMCPEVKAMTVYSHWFRAASCDIRLAFCVLASCDHLTSLRLHFRDNTFNYSVLTALAAYLAGANQLKEVEVHFNARLYNERDIPQDCTESPLIKALRLSEVDCRLLADFVRRSRSLCDLTLSAPNSGRFVRLIAPSATRNYTLLNVCLSDTYGSDEMNVVVDVARRNRSLVARATRFGFDDDRSIYCASAIEFVSRHPKLAETLQDKAAVGERRAKEMIRRALDSLSGLDAYMTAVRVVKDRVECCPRPAAGIQLDQLNHDCWLHVRQYLKVADVLQA
ncbi:hypothetical protein HPB49_018246 [Dermacentor silvarum]|uniref:Uncharacterized protein n=1 Tax=Dermacentor silvarum TaxID=543639 RepID=A0ACB8CS72_DERSI|nr:hypothetical protein HPB49_018246 [Dermacentor silvarum]